MKKSFKKSKQTTIAGTIGGTTVAGTIGGITIAGTIGATVVSSKGTK